MRKIKSFKIFESNSTDIEKVCSLYDDVNQISYILEEDGFEPIYELKVVCVLDGSLEKGIVSFRIRNSDKIREILNRPKCVLREFIIKVRNNNLDLDSFKLRTSRYFEMLREHLEYVPEEFIKMQMWHSKGAYYEISISSNFFV